MSDCETKRLSDEIDYLKSEIDKLKNYDELTGLYNKKKFIESVREKFDGYPEKEYAVICLDVEKFKFINDRFGFSEGDRLLSYIGDKLREKLGEDVPAARISSDVFAFLDEKENVDAERLGREIQNWAQDYSLDADVRIVAGIYYVEARDIPIRLMCDRARFAIATVKNNYTANAAEYNKTVRDYMMSQHKLLNDAERAFENHEFKVYLQPKFDIRTNKVVGAESLVRWIHPERGLVPPGDFIPLFEQNMLITRLDEYVWKETCRLIRLWIDKGYSFVPVSVNVSRLDIYTLDVEKKFSEFADGYQIDRKLIEIEITESAFTKDEKLIIKTVDELRKSGFRVLLDDFGSGYSSLNILKDINVDVLKIDARFLDLGKDGSSKGREILESVIRMAKWIGLQTIAEGVETDEQKRFLLNLGCYYAQGFYFSKPLPEEQFETLIKNPDNVRTESGEELEERTIAIEELFQSDFMTENLLNNILGGVAIYSFDGADDLRLVKANDFYYEATKNYMMPEEYHTTNILERIFPYDREKLIEALKTAKRFASRGASVQVRNFRNDNRTWLMFRLFYLAENENRGMYYASVTDSTEQMRIVNDYHMSRRSFETALELIDAVIAEYTFKTKTLSVKTKLHDGEKYIMGYVIDNIPESVYNTNVVHKDSVAEFKKFCEKVKDTEDVVCCTLDLLHTNNVYKRCDIKSKTMFEDGVPLKAVILIRYTGKIV